MIETSLRPYFVHMTCGHYEIRLMREATAGQRWNSTATVESQAKCAHCRGEAIPHVAPDHLHERDTMCVLDADTAQCIICGVTFGDPCPTCRGRGFHFPGCEALAAENAYNEKRYRHVRCETCGETYQRIDFNGNPHRSLCDTPKEPLPELPAAVPGRGIIQPGGSDLPEEGA